MNCITKSSRVKEKVTHSQRMWAPTKHVTSISLQGTIMSLFFVTFFLQERKSNKLLQQLMMLQLGNLQATIMG